MFICMFIMPYTLTCTVRQGLLDICDQAVLCISPSAQLVNFIAASITLTVPPMMPFVYLTNVSYLPSIAPTICFAPSKSKIHKFFRFPFSLGFSQCQTWIIKCCTGISIIVTLQDSRLNKLLLTVPLLVRFWVKINIYMTCWL